MAFIFCAILLLFIRSENGGRLAWYYMIGCITTITSVCHLKNNAQNKLTTLLIAIFLYVRIISEWGLLLYPYKTFFTNGFRENDKVHAIYEYDSNYDKDKFYR